MIKLTDRLSYTGSRIAVALCALCLALSAEAQTFEDYRRQKKEEFAQYRERKRTQFEQYRERHNKEFARHLSGNWSSYGITPAEQRPSIPGPKAPVKADGASPGKAVALPSGAVKKPHVPSSPPPVTLPPAPDVPPCVISVDFFGTDCCVGGVDAAFMPVAPTGRSVAASWSILSASESAAALTDNCLLLRSQLHLCDWAYLTLVMKVGEAVAPDDTDSATLLSAWLMCQSGYDVRPGIGDGKIRLLYCADRQIYGTPGYNINGRKYFVSRMPREGIRSMETVPAAFSPDNVPLRMVMSEVPRLNYRPANTPYRSSGWKNAPVFEVRPNAALVDFMQSYPLVDWDVYGSSAVSPEIKQSVFAALSVIIDGMTPVDAVNTILDYTQSGFDYMTDGEQFGEEKPFFIEENFVHPFNDCEDRAMLFCRLVHDLLGLDTVFLHYPRHLCAAVAVPGMEQGYNVTVDGRSYWICDPCYIPSKAGDLGAPYRGIKPEIIHVDMP